MKFITAVITTLLATVVSSAAVNKREGGNTDCGANECLCEVVNFAGAGEHEVITFICRYNPSNTDCTKLCG